MQYIIAFVVYLIATIVFVIFITWYMKKKNVQKAFKEAKEAIDSLTDEVFFQVFKRFPIREEASTNSVKDVLKTISDEKRARELAAYKTLIEKDWEDV